MKKSFYFSAALISGKKIKPQDLEKIVQGIESECSNTDLLTNVIDYLDINFQGFITLTIDEIAIDNDLSDQIIELLEVLEKQFPGGCAQDSKIEWYSDYHPTIEMWYKGGNKWEFTQSENEGSSFRMPDWDSDFDGIDEDEQEYW